MPSTVVCKKITKSYPIPNGNPLVILKDIDWEMEKGKLVAICGQSGCGKSTFMNILGLLDRQTSGTLILDSVSFDTARDNASLAAYRSSKIGFIFQQHHLLPELSALQNVMVSELIRGKSKSDALHSSEQILQKLFTPEEIKGGVYQRKPKMMSGGQCQRVAIARALVGNPPLILADEPTGNLDEKSSEQVFNLFVNLQKELGSTVIMVTHNPLQARKADLTYIIREQKLHLIQNEA